MKLHRYYCFSFEPKVIPDEVVVGLRLTLTDSTVEVASIDYERMRAEVFVEISVDAGGVHLTDESIEKTVTIAGTPIPPRLVIQENFAASHAVVTAADILTFRTDTSIQISSLIQKNEVITESPEEDQQLANLGTKSVFENTSVELIMRSFNPVDVSGDESTLELMKKETGLRLYAAAIAQFEPAGQFRDLWRIFEAAFRSQDDTLVAILAKYQPAKDLSFSKSELRKLLVLRGQSSHANSQAGIHQLRKIDIKTKENLDRLKTLAEQVILTKKNWGSPDLEVERLV